MSKINYAILKANPSKMRMFNLILDFITSSVINKALSSTIMAVASSKIQEEPKKAQIRAYTIPYFPSKSLLYDYLFSIGEKSLYDTEIVDILNLLEEKWLISKDYTFDKSGLIEDQEYGLNDKMIAYLHKSGSLYTYLLGFEYSCTHFEKSVYKVEVLINGDIGLGTGWIVDVINIPTPIRLLVTNYHVVKNATWIKVKDINDQEVAYADIENFDHENYDVAFIKIPIDNEIPDFTLANDYGILDEIVTIGYPSIPQSNYAFQVAHKGEINSIINDQWNNKLIIISARTAPGNSGSPVINEKGMVVGMVTKELFEKSAFTEKGITPYSACIPSEILNSLFDKSRIIAEAVISS